MLANLSAAKLPEASPKICARIGEDTLVVKTIPKIDNSKVVAVLHSRATEPTGRLKGT